MITNSSHFWRGNLPVAFIFSAPGQDEEREGKPVSGKTGENLESALKELHEQARDVFSSIYRYDYRITNAYPDPLYIFEGNGRSEATRSEIMNSKEIKRVINEISGCAWVILCGAKAQLLAQKLKDPGRHIIIASHTSNRGLCSMKFKTKSPQSSGRMAERVNEWANRVAAQIKEK